MGPAHGSTRITVDGVNLGCASGVSFGAVRAATFSNVPVPFLDCGTTDELKVTAPPGQAGTTVKITVTTPEGQDTRFGPTKPTATAEFTYQPSTPSAPLDLRAQPGAGAVTLSWKAPATTGGDAITAYAVTVSSAGEATTTHTYGPATFGATLSSLPAGGRHDFVVAAVSKLGQGLPASVTATPKS